MKWTQDPTYNVPADDISRAGNRPWHTEIGWDGGETAIVDIDGYQVCDCDPMPHVSMDREACGHAAANAKLIVEAVNAYKPHDLPAELKDLYDVADDDDANTLDELREKAGHVWTCRDLHEPNWTNIADEKCEKCGLTQAESEKARDALLNPRERGDDDGREYADPRDAQDGTDR